MVSSLSFENLSLDDWRARLQEIDFWLKGYLESDAYYGLRRRLNAWYYMQWNAGVRPTASFVRAISSIMREGHILHGGPFDIVIDVDMNQEPVSGMLDTEELLTLRVAEQLGLYSRPKEEDIDLEYYTYGMQNSRDTPRYLPPQILPQVIQKLSTKRYLLVVENLCRPIKDIKTHEFTEGVSIPPAGWNRSQWLISTASQDVYAKSVPDYRSPIVEFFSGDSIIMLTLYSLHQAAKYISEKIGGDIDEKHWHLVSISCFRYAAAVLLIPHHGDGYQWGSNELAGITGDELIRQWAAKGILPVTKKRVQERRMGEMKDKFHAKHNDGNIYQVGNVILEAFQEHSLLQLPVSPVTKDDEVTRTAAHFLAYHGLIAQQLTSDDELCDEHLPGLECMQWIPHAGDQRWHVSREWLSHGTMGPTTLIIRHYSHQPSLLVKLDQLLAKLPYLHVLDLSYTPLESLPPSLCCLQHLRLLSLRGCYNLTSPLSFQKTERTIPGKNGNNRTNLLYLDLSNSNVKTFSDDFFHSMPDLQELILGKCSNLVELPPSIAALSSLTTLELTGTQIKYFHWGVVFEGWKSSSMEEEVKLEGHPSLRSFSLTSAPRIRRLSLRGCRKLEYVEIKELGALEELDLSDTAIKEISSNILNLPRLRQLLLVGVPALRRFPWHELQRLPDVFCLDQCSERNCNHSNNTQVARVCISDSKMFYSFNEKTKGLVRDEHLLKSFCIRVTSCKTGIRKMMTSNKIQVSASTYADVNCRYLTEGVSMVSMDSIPPFGEAKRHVEISSLDQYPHGLKHLLEVTKSISMTDDAHVSSLCVLSELDELEQFELRRCHRMVHVFKELGLYWLRKALKNAWVSHLRCLTHFHGPSDNGVAVPVYFYALKHLRLEHCPRLEAILPCGSTLPSLVTLDILFCYNLKSIFYDKGYVRHQDIPCLRSIRLQELPLLEHLDNDDATVIAPVWEEFHIRGCWSLRRLPRLSQHPCKVKVNGERAWWAKLHWDEASHRESYEPMLPPSIASFRERVVRKSYLR